jgi:hypothetical protein
MAEDAQGSGGPCVVAQGCLGTPALRASEFLALMTALAVDFSIGTSTHEGASPWNCRNRSS